MKLEKPSPETIIRSTSLLAPWFENRLIACVSECNSQGYPIAVYESYRSPVRQDYLYSLGRSRIGKIVTRAQAWQSWHQYGLACDLAFYHERKWSWEGAWDKVLPIFHAKGFKSLDFEKSHVEITGGMMTGDARAIVTRDGIEALWDTVLLRLGTP